MVAAEWASPVSGLAVSPPVPVSDEIRLRRFQSPAPSRRIAMVWRKTSALRDFLPRLAPVIGDLPGDLLSGAAIASGQASASDAAADPPAGTHTPGEAAAQLSPSN